MMAFPERLTWRGECVCYSNPWNLQESRLEKTLDESMAMRFINGMSSDDWNERTASLQVIANLIRLANEPVIFHTFGRLIKNVVNDVLIAIKSDDKYLVKYGMALLANITYSYPIWNNFMIQDLRYYQLLELISSVPNGSDAQASCAMAFGNIAIDGSKNEDKWEYQFDCILKLQEIAMAVRKRKSCTKVCEMIVWALAMFLTTNKATHQYSQFITQQTIRLMAEFYLVQSVNLYKNMAVGLCSHRCIQLLQAADVKVIIKKITWPVRHGWHSSYIRPIMEILTYALWCFKDKSNNARRLVPRAVLNVVKSLSIDCIMNKVSCFDTQVEIISWIIMFYLKYFKTTGILLTGSATFGVQAIEISDCDLSNIATFFLARITQSATELQLDRLRMVPDIFSTLCEQNGKHSQAHDQMIDEATFILLFGQE